MSQYVVHFHCPIDQATTERFRDRCLQAVAAGADSLLLNLSTIGGSTHLGFSLYSFLKSLPVPLCAVNAGNIESMGIVMYLAAGERIAAPHSRFLIHPMTWHFSQSAVDHSRLREYLSSLNNDLERYARIFDLETAQAERRLDIIHCLSAEEKVVPAYESLACGIAHRLEQLVFDKDAVHLTVSADS